MQHSLHSFPTKSLREPFRSSASLVRALVEMLLWVTPPYHFKFWGGKACDFVTVVMDLIAVLVIATIGVKECIAAGYLQFILTEEEEKLFF